MRSIELTVPLSRNEKTMAQVWKTHVNQQDGSIYRSTGETITVEGCTYVKRKFLGELHPVDGWQPTQEAADCVAAAELQKRLAILTATVAELLRPVPAAAAADSSAAGAAQAVVAT